MVGDVPTGPVPGTGTDRAHAPVVRGEAAPAGPTGPAVTRLAARTIRASGWRGVLVVALVGLSVAVATGLAVGMRSAQVPEATRVTWAMGAADVLATVEPDPSIADFERLSPEQQAHVVAEAERRGVPSDEVARWTSGIDPSDPRVPFEDKVLVARQAGLVADLTRLEHGSVWHQDLGEVHWYAGEPGHPLHAGRLVAEGPSPVPGQALVSERVLELAGVEVGDRLDLSVLGADHGADGPAREVEVVGTVRVDAHVTAAVVVLAAGEPIPTSWSRVEWLFDADDPSALALALCCDASGESDVGAGIVTREQRLGFERDDWTAEQVVTEPSFVGSALGAVLLVQVGFVAAAAFATGTRRRVRELGMLGAVGAGPEQLRALVRREGLVLGALAGLLGALVGVLVVAVGRPLLVRMVGHAVEGLALHPLDVLGPAALGAAAALAAAWVPARTVARIPTTTALAGRVPLHPVPRWVAPVALATSAGGVLLLLAARARVVQRPVLDDVLLVGGVVAVLVGMATLGVPLVGALGRVADRLPALPRLAIRDSSRQRTRSAAAIAALSVVLVAPVLASIGHATDQVRYVEPSGRLLTVRAEAFHGLVPLPLDDEAVDQALAGLEVVDTATGLASGQVPGDVHLQLDDAGSTWWLSLAAVEQDALALFGLEEHAGDLAAGRGVVVDPHLARRLEAMGRTTLDVAREPGFESTAQQPGDTTTGQALTVVTGDVDESGFGPEVLVSPETARRIGVDAADASEVRWYRLAEPLTPAQHVLLDERVHGAERRPGFWVSAFAPRELDGLAAVPFTAWALLGALLLALLVQGLVTALAATESDRDLGLMAAVGAPPGLRRRFHAVQATVHGLVAGALALAGGLLLWHAGNVDHGHELGSTVLPWGELLAVVVGVPVVAGVVLGAVMRPAPATAPRRIA